MSFACAVVGQLHLNGFLFPFMSIDKTQTELLFLFAKTFKLDGYFDHCKQQFNLFLIDQDA